MGRGDLRRAMRRERREIAASLRQLREVAREELRRDPVLRRAQARRRVRRGLLAAGFLAVVLLLRCQCERPPPVSLVASTPVVRPAAAKAKPTAPTAKPPPLRAHVERQPRGHFANPAPTAPSWLDAFQLQVSARSPRLAACFSGADRPGALRWTASLDPKSGRVGDHAFEPVGSTAELTPAQRACAVKVLSSPTYKLSDSALHGIPARIALVIAF